MLGTSLHSCWVEPERPAPTAAEVQLQELPIPMPPLEWPVLPVVAVTTAAPSSTPAVEQDLTPAPMDLSWMAGLTPHQLIVLAFTPLGPANLEKALYVACREGGLDKGPSRVNGKPVNPCKLPYRRVDTQPPYGPACSADNPTSSASGMFQYLASWAGWGGYSWADIVGPDCLTDVLMTVDVVRTQGWGPWE